MAPVILLMGFLSPLLSVAVVLLIVLLHRTRLRIRTLEREARHDPLTGLPNRRGLALHWDAMPGDKALLLIDLVGFKTVNDSHGHIVGDALLKQVSARLAATVPAPGLLARWGGDEFVALIPAARIEAQTALIANARVMAYDLSAAGGPEDVRISARTGLAIGEADLGPAIQAAARALLEEKASPS